MAQGKKTGGRRKGTSNKVTKDLRLLVKELLEKELGMVHTQLNNLEPIDRINLLIKLLPYALPKYQDMAIQEEKNAASSNFFQEINRKLSEGKK